jgi:hypothetical protein
MSGLPMTENFGFDYETSGMPLDVDLVVSGAAICTRTVGGFISLTDIRHQVGEGSGEYKQVLSALAIFLVTRMNHIWVFNMQFEFQVSHRLLGVDLYDLCDASVINTIEGYHMKKYSLKWTAQRVLQVGVWDTEFDRISDLIDKMMFDEVGKLKRDKHKIIKVERSNFEYTPEWKYLAGRYPDDIDEMKNLMLEYWGQAFMVPSSRLLGYYCCLDALHTLMIYETKRELYSEDCWKVNLDNTRLGSRLMASGLYIDEDFRQKYEGYCKEQMAWSITYCAMARCWVKMEKHKVLATNIKRYKPEAVKLMEANKFHGGDAVEIAKEILLDHIDTMDAYDTGVNEGKLVMTFGVTFAERFMDVIRKSMQEVKMKVKIDESISRKRKILGLIAEKLIPILGLDKLNLGKKHIELEKYMYYERAYKELRKITDKQLTDIKSVPSEIYAFGKKMTLLEYSDYVGDNYFKCKSPIENVLPGIRETTKGRVISLFGLPGARDQSKAAGMGKIGAKYSDILIFTEDDARGNVRAQSEKMAAGVSKDFAKKGGEVKFVDDRKKAIEEAMKIAKAGDTVVLLGKGPEKIIARMKNGKVVDEPWDEEKTARNAIEKSLVSSKKTVVKSKKISKK